MNRNAVSNGVKPCWTTIKKNSPRMIQSQDDLCHAKLSLQVELNPLHGVLPRLVGEQAVGESVNGKVTHGMAAFLVQHDPSI